MFFNGASMRSPDIEAVTEPIKSNTFGRATSVKRLKDYGAMPQALMKYAGNKKSLFIKKKTRLQKQCAFVLKGRSKSILRLSLVEKASVKLSVNIWKSQKLPGQYWMSQVSVVKY